MSWTSIFTGGVDKIVDSVAKGIDEAFTSDEERLAAKNTLEKIKSETRLHYEELNLEFEREITKRWTSDNEHIVTRLVRPISYASVLALFGIIVVADGNMGEFTVNGVYVPVIESLLAIMTVAYFGSRGAEKISKSLKK